MRLSRLSALFASVLVIAASAVGNALARSDAPFRLIVTHLDAPLVPNSVMDIADALGYFAAEGIDVELVRVQQTPSALAALQAGSGDMANIGVDALLQIHHRGGSDLRAVSSPNKSLPFLIAAHKTIETIDDLAGARFGIGRIGSLDHALSTRVLEALGFSIDEADLVALGQPSIRAQALAAGRIDATTFSIGVWSELPDTDGLHILVDQASYYQGAPVVQKVNVVSDAVLDARRDDVEAVLRALVKLSRDIAENPGIWVDAMADLRPDIDRDILVSLAAAFAGDWTVNGGMSASELGFTQDWLYETEDFKDLPELVLSDWVDFAPVDSVLLTLGVDPAMDRADR